MDKREKCEVMLSVLQCFEDQLRDCFVDSRPVVCTQKVRELTGVIANLRRILKLPAREFSAWMYGHW